MQKIQELLKEDKKVLILCSQPLDLDSITSGLVMKKYLESLGKQVEAVFTRSMKIDERLDFEYLPYFSELKYVDGRIYMEKKQADTLIFVDGSSPHQFFDQKIDPNVPDLKIYPKRIQIDHHLQKPELADEVFYDSTASSTMEVILTQIVPEDFFDPLTATLAYAGILGDTGNFRWNFTSKTMKLAGMLLDKGAQPFEVLEKMFFSKSKEDLEAISFISQNIEFDKKSKTVFLPLSLKQIKLLNLSEDFVDKVKDVFPDEVAHSMKGYPRGVRLSEDTEGEIKISARGSSLYNKINLPEFFQKIGGSGGGHFNACGFSFKGNFEEVKRKIQEALQKEV